MTVALLNRSAFTPTTAGTGSWTVSAALTGFQTPATAGAVDTNFYPYFATGQPTEWEYGYATSSSSGTVFSRTVIASSNAGSAVNFASAPTVYMDVLGDNLVPEEKWNGGRLTFTSATPVLRANTTAQSTLLWTPYNSDWMTLVDANGVYRTNRAAEGSVSAGVASGLAISLDTTNFLSTKIYDVFGCIVAGVPRQGYGPAWTNNTTRSAAISRVQGLWTNTAAITLRFDATHTQASIPIGQAVYLGTVVGTANGQSGMNFIPTAAAGGTGNILGLYNAFNQVPLIAMCRDSATWTYTSTTWRQADAGTAANNDISYIDGLGDVAVNASYSIFAGSGGVSGSVGPAIGINLNSSSATPTTGAGVSKGSGATVNTQTQLTVDATFLPVLGFNTIYAMEVNADATTAASFTGSGFVTSWGQTMALIAQLAM